MAEKLEIAEDGKAEKYEVLLRQVKAMAEIEHDEIALMANVASMIHETFGFLWTGFYRVAGDELILGPFQGPLACTRIKFGRGVCGRAWELGETLVVEDVDKFPGHIACSSASRSEIVVPVKRDGIVVAVLDIDSSNLAEFDATDALWLTKIADLLGLGPV